MVPSVVIGSNDLLTTGELNPSWIRAEIVISLPSMRSGRSISVSTAMISA